MDTLAHATRGLLIGYYIQGWELAVVGACCEAWVDLYGEYKAHTMPRLPDGNKDYSVYKKIHDAEHWSKWIPFVLDHISLDKLGHDKNNTWYPAKWWEYFNPYLYREAMWLETLGWVINITLIINLIIRHYV